MTGLSPGRWVGLALALAAWLAPRTLAAQQAGRLIAGARQQLEDINPDSAARLLGRALDPRSGAETVERVRALVLLGISELMHSRPQAARQAFRLALERDAALRVDSLAHLHADLLREFAAERAAYATAPAARPAVTVIVATDTTVEVGGRLQLELRPPYRARLVVAVAPADSPLAVLWSDTLVSASVAATGWDLRSKGGTRVADGRYTLRVTATDSLGQVSLPVERLLDLARIPVDTQHHPPPLDTSLLAPEFLRLARASPRVLAAGGVLALAAALLPSLGRSELEPGRESAGAWAVAGTVSVAALVGYLAGHRIQALPENATRNAELRARDAEERRAVLERNRALFEGAPVRVRVAAVMP